MRIGFAVKVLGEGGLKECDMRRWQNSPHLKCSLELLREVFHYLDRNDLRMYRMSSDIAPYLTHPDLPQFHSQLEEAKEELAELGALARKYDIRLSLHPSQYIVLNAIDESVAEKSIRDLIAQGAILDAMGAGSDAVVVTHVGGAYGDKSEGIKRFAARYQRLPEATRKRLVVENDDVTYTAKDALRVHELCGIRMVFDNLHHFCNNPPGGDRMNLREALERALATWPADQTPKVHYSSPRTEAVEGGRKAGKAGKMDAYQTAPDLRLHADYINPFEFLYYLEKAEGLRPFDVMVESKAKDLSVLKLRKDLGKYGPLPI
jgi:UV DNA damage endonuclease